MPPIARGQSAFRADEPEFAFGQDQPPDELSRRQFLALSGATLAAASAALAGCTRAPAQKIIPYRVQPSEIVPGRPLHYATAASWDGYARGLLVESHEGRPSKIEGNPEHPASLGASSAAEQALLLELYDPRRLRALSRRGAPVSQTELLSVLSAAGDRERKGRGVHVVLPALSSPLVAEQLAELALRLPELTLHFHVPLARSAAWQGAKLAFGKVLDARVELRRADVVLALAADPLARGPNALALARAFAERRQPSSQYGAMNRLYVVETAMSVTGANADQRLALPPSQIPRFAAALLRTIALASGGQAAAAVHALPELALSGEAQRFVTALAADLLSHRGASAVLVGDEQPAEVHAAACALNALLENGERVLSYVPPVVLGSDQDDYASLQRLHAALATGSVETLLVFDSDIAYASAGDLELARLLPKARRSVSFGLFRTRTSAACEFEAPAAHVLESWLDTRALDGTTSLVQPLLSPLYSGMTVSELFARLLGDPEPNAHDLLKRFWQRAQPSQFDEFWETALARGVVAASQSALEQPGAPSFAWLGRLARDSAERGIELSLCGDPRLHDGRLGNQPWLLELPCPVTKLTWDNAVWFGPALAEQLGVASGDVVKLSAFGRSLLAPALIVPGHADGAISLALGWGRDSFDGTEVAGVDAYQLLDSTRGQHTFVHVARSGKRAELALTQDSMRLAEGAEAIVLTSTLAEYQGRRAGGSRIKRQLSLYSTDAAQSPRQWGMTIDLNACTGCSACVVACQAENNIPSVGKRGVLKRREMHWLRIDRYLTGSDAAPRVLQQPMACQHCEKAPCEYVCPTGATVHSSDGLNQMVYNRCVGTRFCSNNCPYKVRRFNWFNYHESERSPRELAQNPEVTVRARGVMEKCTYCVQRIRTAEIRARSVGRALAAGEVQTACEQACPTRAIAFGDVNDPSSEVSRLRASERAFEVLAELGSAPRTRYLMKLSNPNPELA
jgi:molybdopterin-containing oxidoreductase family iron-sulfur binding subunit